MIIQTVTETPSAEQVQQQHDQIQDMLRNHVCEVTFTKLDGEQRVMTCTLMPSTLPPAAPVKENHRIRAVDPGTISAYDLTQQAWRSFKTMRVTEVIILTQSQIEPDTGAGSVEQTSGTSWTVTLGEDPVTGELVMPFPDTLMLSMGWNLGDTLHWDANSCPGSFVLTRSSVAGDQ
jgi:hypothetical protein